MVPSLIWQYPVHTIDTDGVIDMSSETPEYDGECSFAVSLGKTDEPQSGKHRLEMDGRTFYFRNGIAKGIFKLMNRADKADAAWAARS